MSIAPKSLTFSATMTGSVNHEALSLTGQGQIDPSLGLAEGRYTFRTLPKSFDPNLLTAFLITGYPDAAASIGNVANLFRDHSYGYRRTVTFREGGELRFRASCMLKGGHITSKLHLVGQVEVPELTSAEPLVESWEPNGPGGVLGHFTISWRRDDGSVVTADADSNYQIYDEDATQDGILHRFIQVRSAVDSNTLHQMQTAGLFSELPKSLWIPDDAKRQVVERDMASI